MYYSLYDWLYANLYIAVHAVMLVSIYTARYTENNVPCEIRLIYDNQVWLKNLNIHTIISRIMLVISIYVYIYIHNLI